MNATSFNTADRLAPRAFGVSGEESLRESQDRIMLTLLALGLMLLAFFVVLNSASSIDQNRAREVAIGVQAAFEQTREEKAAVETASPGDANHRAAVGALRASVADLFAAIVPGDHALFAAADPNADRVEVDVPADAFFADATLRDPLPVIDRLVGLAALAPAGYRMELVVRAVGGDARLPLLADALVRRGFAPTALSVGALTGAATPTLRFTFLLLDSADDLAAGMIAGKAGS